MRCCFVPEVHDNDLQFEQYDAMLLYLQRVKMIHQLWYALIQSNNWFTLPCQFYTVYVMQNSNGQPENTSN